MTSIAFPRRDVTSSTVHFRARRGQTKPLAGHTEEGDVDGIALQAQMPTVTVSRSRHH